MSDIKENNDGLKLETSNTEIPKESIENKQNDAQSNNKLVREIRMLNNQPYYCMVDYSKNKYGDIVQVTKRIAAYESKEMTIEEKVEKHKEWHKKHKEWYDKQFKIYDEYNKWCSQEIKNLNIKIETLLKNNGNPTREPIPQRVKRYVWQRDKGKCVNCGSNEKIEYDHIIPVIKGGSNTERNIQLLCESCNRTKSSNI